MFLAVLKKSKISTR